MFQSHFLLGATFATVEDSRIAADRFAQGTVQLRSLRKACALLFASPSTAKSGLKPRGWSCIS
jgi:hypothetical protein